MTVTATIPTTDREAIEQIIAALIAADYALGSVDDGGDEVNVQTSGEALDAIMAVDSAHLYVHSPRGRLAMVWFVLGNEPFEVAANYSVSLEYVVGTLTESWFA